MAIEFDIKMARPISSGALLARVALLLGEFGVGDSPEGDKPADTRWGDAEMDATVRLNETIASILAHKAGEEVDLGEEGGFWVTVSAARSRTGAGVFLAAVVAIAVGQETGSSVTDEAGLLRLGRAVSPADALAQLQRLAGRGALQEIGGRLADSLGLSLPA
jgi:hypothetical protein